MKDIYKCKKKLSSEIVTRIGWVTRTVVFQIESHNKSLYSPKTIPIF